MSEMFKKPDTQGPGTELNSKAKPQTKLPKYTAKYYLYTYIHPIPVWQRPSIFFQPHFPFASRRQAGRQAGRQIALLKKETTEQQIFVAPETLRRVF